MRHTLLRPLAASSAIAIVLATAAPVARVAPARRPHYGGTLRVEIGPAVSSIDPTATPANPDELAAKRQIESLIYEKRNPDGSPSGVAGSGPFRISEWEPGKHLTLAANQDFPAGRPFVDSIEIEMGRSPHDRLQDLELDRTDFTEIPAEDARAASTRGVRISASPSDELVALVFVNGLQVADARRREALACSVDRAAIVEFILQKEGEPAGGLLPQWSSGTAFLFPTAPDTVRAKELRAQIGASPEIRLGYDSGDALEESIAERIVVDARESGIVMAAQADAAGAGGTRGEGARLERLLMTSPPAGAALANLIARLQPMTGISVATPAEPDAEQIVTIQKEALEGFHVVPLVWLPHVYGLSERVKDWQVPVAGEPWPLADVWIDQGAKQN